MSEQDETPHVEVNAGLAAAHGATGPEPEPEPENPPADDENPEG